MAGEGGEVDGDRELRTTWPPGHFYSPVPDHRELALEPARSRVWPPKPYPTLGIDWRSEAQRRLCTEVFARQRHPEFPDHETAGPHEYYHDSGMFPAIDAWVLQAMLRHLRPARMIEVGCGLSSLVSARVNRDFLEERMRFTCIDPHPRDFLREGVPGISELRAEPVQDTPLELFDELSAGDVLFVDTSHTVKTGGDVPWIYHRIIPRLASGVFVHIHDAFLPGEYPPPWVLEGRAWNELYLLQSFLTFNSAFEIVLGVHWMGEHHPKLLEAAFPGFVYHPWEAASLWIRRL